MTAAARREVIEDAATEVFAEHGYRGASIDLIASRSGVTPPVVYDHFESKRDLYRRLLERHFAELRQVWRRHLPGPEHPEQRIARAVDAWFAYIGTHPFAGRMLFRDTTGNPDIASMHDEVAAESRSQILPLFAAEPGNEGIIGPLVEEGLEMTWVVLRGVLQGLAMWWAQHPDVPRERVVAMAMNSLWIGFERVRDGEGFRPDAARQ
jgi:AcrR family transcriptional regulator